MGPLLQILGFLDDPGRGSGGEAGMHFTRHFRSQEPKPVLGDLVEGSALWLQRAEFLFIYFFLFFLFLFFIFSKAAPETYGGSQARGSNPSCSCQPSP